MVIYPNLLNEGQSFKVNNSEKGVLSIYSLQGALLEKLNIEASATIKSNLTHGTYILKFTSSNITKKAKLIVR